MTNHPPWDNAFPLSDLENTLSTPTAIDISAVRAGSIADTSLGTVFWIAVANKYLRAGAEVTIYDFPDNGSPEVLPSQQLVDTLGMDGVQVLKAEDQDQSVARDKLEEFSQAYNQNPDDFPGIHPAVAKGLRKSEGDSKLGPSLDRMVEELAVFMIHPNDSTRVQLMAHEKETVQLIRYLGDIDKQYWRVDLGGIESEYRAIKIPTISELPGRLMMGKSQGQVYYDFFMYVFEALTDVIIDLGYNKYPEPVRDWDRPKADYDRSSYMRDISRQINPDLDLYFGSMLIDAGVELRFMPFSVFEEVAKANRAVADSENPDYGWVLRLLSVTSTGDKQGKSVARTIIKSALPTLDADELFYHGDRFWKTDNKGRALIFIEEYFRRGYRKHAQEFAGFERGSGAANKTFARLITGHGIA
tara:strand:- start:6757 stop:8001 length:1245 start_codon:yes stop_codon:yes gene_type:complete